MNRLSNKQIWWRFRDELKRGHFTHAFDYIKYWLEGITEREQQ